MAIRITTIVLCVASINVNAQQPSHEPVASNGDQRFRQQLKIVQKPFAHASEFQDTQDVIKTDRQRQSIPSQATHSNEEFQKSQNATLAKNRQVADNESAEESNESAAENQEKPQEEPEKQPLFRPLKSVSLKNALNLSDELRLPDNQARQYMKPFKTIVDISGGRPTPVPSANVHLPWYQPLYFEEPNLERAGHHHGCLTDVVSIGWFFGRIPVLPYMQGATPPHSCVRSLGHCGRCQAFGANAYLPPPSLKGAAFQAVASIGFIFLVP